ncbi:MAG: M17 family peptidase N-terminal domain-containing protein, partial [Oceanospirillum sp.]|nr:M17 family peptidase N-terminal domain-containing protein [Oceanospirillum sp.]
MSFNATTQALSELTADCRIVFVGHDATLGNNAQQLDKASGGAISRILELGDFTGKFGQTQLLPQAGELNGRLLLVGTGKADELKDGKFRTLIKNLITAVKETKITSLALSLEDVEIKGRDLNWKARLLAENTVTTLYVFDQLKSKQADPSALKEIILSVPGAEGAVQKALDTGAAVGEGMNLTRTLGNLPGNICTPVYLAQQAEELAKDFDELSLTILDENQMAELGMGSLLSVAKGSVEAPRLVVMEYKGNGDAKPHVLVGKGVTFDT